MISLAKIPLYILMLLVPCVALAWEGKVIAIDRGDQIQVMKDIGKIETVRLYGIGSPGEPQPFGQTAKLYTHKRILGKIVRVDPIITDPFHRVIAWVYIDGESLNKELLRKGMAWWYRKYLPFETELAELEEQARKEKIGLWAHPSPIPPWEFHPADYTFNRPKRRKHQAWKTGHDKAEAQGNDFRSGRRSKRDNLNKNKN